MQAGPVGSPVGGSQQSCGMYGIAKFEAGSLPAHELASAGEADASSASAAETTMPPSRIRTGHESTPARERLKQGASYRRMDYGIVVKKPINSA